ncbi:MAG: hypothetical protein WAK21_14530, partial [Candidatus Sulfotelmatobacter sp.]
MKRSPQFAALLFTILAFLSPSATSQDTHVSRSGDAWEQVMSGSLTGVRNLHVKVDVGSVSVHGGGPQGINYVVHMR